MQSFMTIHITNKNLEVKTSIVTVNGLRLFFVVYKLVNLIHKCGVSLVLLCSALCP